LLIPVGVMILSGVVILFGVVILASVVILVGQEMCACQAVRIADDRRDLMPGRDRLLDEADSGTAGAAEDGELHDVCLSTLDTLTSFPYDTRIISYENSSIVPTGPDMARCPRRLNRAIKQAPRHDRDAGAR
jgi:hypothetical protein